MTTPNCNIMQVLLTFFFFQNYVIFGNERAPKPQLQTKSLDPSCIHARNCLFSHEMVCHQNAHLPATAVFPALHRTRKVLFSSNVLLQIGHASASWRRFSSREAIHIFMHFVLFLLQQFHLFCCFQSLLYPKIILQVFLLSLLHYTTGLLLCVHRWQQMRANL